MLVTSIFSGFLPVGHKRLELCGRVNPFPNKRWFLHVCSRSHENTVQKGEIPHNKQFLLFSQCFLPIWRNFFHFNPFPNTPF